MSGISWLAVHFFSQLIRQYPASFQAQFGAEMTAVTLALLINQAPPPELQHD